MLNDNNGRTMIQKCLKDTQQERTSRLITPMPLPVRRFMESKRHRMFDKAVYSGTQELIG